MSKTMAFLKNEISSLDDLNSFFIGELREFRSTQCYVSTDVGCLAILLFTPVISKLLLMAVNHFLHIVDNGHQFVHMNFSACRKINLFYSFNQIAVWISVEEDHCKNRLLLF